MATLIRDALIVPDSATLPFEGWVRVSGGAIAALGAGACDSRPDDTLVDGAGHVLMPGLVNTHGHSHSSLTRGSAEGVRLEDWLRVIEREQAILTDEQAYVGGLATYAEALLAGTTTMMDMCVRPEAAARAARDIGMRVVIAPYVADAKAFAPDLARTEAILLAAAPHDRVRVWVGLHDLESCSDAQIADGVALAKQHGTGIHLHCAESRVSRDTTWKRTGRTPVAQLDHLGALTANTLLAHCVWIDDGDRLRLAERGTHIAHCPHANLKLGSGVAAIPTARRAGIDVALATDGAKANNRLDMFDVMKFASLLPKGLSHDPSVLPACDVLDMATAGGARALGLPIGRIAAGLAADLILVDACAFHLQPMTAETAATNLVHAVRGSDVRWVMVGGDVLVRDGRLADPQWVGLAAEARAVGLDLIAAVRRMA